MTDDQEAVRKRLKWNFTETQTPRKGDTIRLAQWDMGASTNYRTPDADHPPPRFHNQVWRDVVGVVEEQIAMGATFSICIRVIEAESWAGFSDYGEGDVMTLSDNESLRVEVAEVP